MLDGMAHRAGATWVEANSGPSCPSPSGFLQRFGPAGRHYYVSRAQQPLEPLTTSGQWPDGLVALYADRFDDLVRLSFLVTGDSLVAEDVVQEAFLAARDRWADIEQPEAYVRTCVVNGSRSWLRRRRVERRNIESTPAPTLSAPDEIWDALGKLTPEQRTVIVLRYYEDLSHKQIARLLDIALSTSRVLQFRGIRQLRREIKR